MTVQLFIANLHYKDLNLFFTGVVYNEQQREVITSSYTRINLNPRPPSSISIDKVGPLSLCLFLSLFLFVSPGSVYLYLPLSLNHCLSFSHKHPHGSNLPKIFLKKITFSHLSFSLFHFLSLSLYVSPPYGSTRHV